MESAPVKNGKKIPGIIFTIVYMMLLTGVGYVGGKDTAELIQYGVFSLILGGLVSLCIRKYFPISATDPEISEKGESRLWIIVYLCMLLSVLFSYFPNTMWVFVPVFVILSLFSSPLVGITIASVLLAGCAMISGCGALVFFLYFVSGVFSVMVYLPLTEEMRFAMPALLSSACLLVCEMCGIILTINSAFDIQLLILPCANCLIGMMVIYSAFRGYSSLVMFKYYDLYQTLCDTENEKLLELKNDSPKEYMLSIHTAYFCDRVSSCLGLDADIVKCAGYYHELTPENIDDRDDFYDEMGFTEGLIHILDEYKEYILNPGISLIRKEAAVLVCSRTVVMTFMALFEKDKNAEIDTGKLIDAVFDRFISRGTFNDCEITFSDISKMKKIFKEEKLYYDFLK